MVKKKIVDKPAKQTVKSAFKPKSTKQWMKERDSQLKGFVSLVDNVKKHTGRKIKVKEEVCRFMGEVA